MSHINNTLEFINAGAKMDPEGFVTQCEHRYQNILKQLAQEIHNGSRHEIIMLAGPSCAGKTTTARLLSEELEREGRQVFTISLDDYYRDVRDAVVDEFGKPDFETVEALDLPLLRSNLRELMFDGRTEKPLFDFLSGARSQKTEQIQLGEGDVVVVEGLHALNPVVLQDLPPESLLKLYVNVSSRIYNEKGDILLNKRNMRFIRRLVRDYYTRNSSVENTFSLWESVQRGEEKYLFPFKETADRKVNSIHLYEDCVLQAAALELLESVSPENRYYAQARRLIRSLHHFETLPVELVPENSLLCEFIKQ